jgi:hypothetical protein
MLTRTQPQTSPATHERETRFSPEPLSPAAKAQLLRVGRRVQLGLAFAVALLATWSVWSAGNWLLDRWQFF